MSSKTWWAGFALVLVACGNYSNDDVEFLNALPHQQDLSAKIPKSSGSGLGDPDAGCTQGLDTASCFYIGTYAAAQQFNGVINFALALVDAAESIPPSSRTSTSRVWGPFPDQSQPAFDGEVVVSRTPPDHYAYALQFRRHTAAPTDPWIPLVTGVFEPTGGARKGPGTLHIDVAGARANGLDTPGLETVDTLDSAFNTGTVPIHVSMNIGASNDGGTGSLVYAYREYPLDGGSDGGIHAAALQYTLTLDPTGGTPLTLAVDAGWLASGSGSAFAQVTAGDQQKIGFSDTECWLGQPNFLTTYLVQTWSGGMNVGNPLSCPDLSGL